MRLRRNRRRALIPALQRVLDRLRTRPRTRLRPSLEGLESRSVPSTVLPNLRVFDASTPDSRSVVVDYAIEGIALTRPVTLGVYRSADDRLDLDDRLVGALSLATADSGAPTLDAAGRPAADVGVHQLTIPLPGYLPPNPSRPYVLVAADPGGELAEADEGDNVAGFRKHVVGIVVHGGIQSSRSQPPLWARKLARGLLDIGYEYAVPYSWAAESRTPGAAAKQGPRVANIARHIAATYPADEPVDLHLIGHSEGAVVVSQALLALGRTSTPQLQAGYTRATFLDPHAANNDAPGGQFSVSSGLDGWIAKQAIETYQSMAKDPLVIVPGDVEAAEVYYQHTPVQLNGANDGTYNLWGQVPILGDAQYSDLTGPGIAHTGAKGVQVWYHHNVVPRLADDDGSFYNPTRITAERIKEAPDDQEEILGRMAVTWSGHLAYAGTAAPGASVTIRAQPVGAADLLRVGATVADPEGTWAVSSSRQLPPGAYRVIARGMVPAGLPSPRTHHFPTVLLDRLVVAPHAERAIPGGRASADLRRPG